MSRSFKKINIVKDSNSYGKKSGNKMFRRKSKQITSQVGSDDDLQDELPVTKSEVINDYDVCDWWFFVEGKRGDGKVSK